jgi:uncharacterized OB-fold protein
MPDRLPERRDTPAGLWYAALAAGVIPRTVCGRCGRAEAYGKVTCLACGSADLVTGASGGVGSVYAVTTVYRPPAEVLAADVPYALALVDLTDCDGRVLVHFSQPPQIGDTVRVIADAEASPPILRGVGLRADRDKAAAGPEMSP